MRTLALALMVGCTSTQDDELGDTGESGGDTADTSDTAEEALPSAHGGDSATAQFGLAFVELLDEDGDGDWELGETATLNVALTNQGDDDFAYPGCELRSEDLASGQGEWPLFGLAAGQTETCTWTLAHLADAAAGDVVEVVAIVDRLNCADNGDCPEENPLTMRFQLFAVD